MHIAALFGGKSTITNFAFKKFLNARFSVESKIFRIFSLVTTLVTGQSALVPWYQSYEIKSPPLTILWFRILRIFSVENIDRLGVFMFQT